MLSFLRSILCCGLCNNNEEEDALNERARLLQYQIPTTPAQPVLPQELVYQQRMGTIVRATEGKMVNLTARLPFNLHNRVLDDSLEYSRSNSYDCDNGDDDNDDIYQNYNYSNIHQNRRKRVHTEDYTYNYYAESRSHTPTSNRDRSNSSERIIDRPAAALNIRLVGVTDTERGRARERTGLGGTSVASSDHNPAPLRHPPDQEVSEHLAEVAQQLKFRLKDPEDMILASWNA